MIDTHAHINDEKLFPLRTEILKSAQEAGIEKVICTSYDLATSKRACQIANEFEDVFATVGIHPHDAKNFVADSSIEQQLKILCSNKKIVAYGEIGLDFYYNLSEKNVQKEAFLNQLKLANDLKLPLIIHMRNATKEMLEILQAHSDLLNQGGIMHCFSEDYEIAKKVLDLGLIFSFGGILTFKNSGISKDVLKKIPKNSFVLETDSPYLAPVPYRGKINQPKYLVEIVKAVAEILGISYTEVENLTNETAQRVLPLLT